MSAIGAAVLCLAWITGLLLTAIPGQVLGVPVTAIVCLGGGFAAALILPRLWRAGCKARIWLAVGAVGFMAIVYFQMRMPQPGAQDISHLVTTSTATAEFVVRGKISSSPRLTRSQRIQFWLDATQVQQSTELNGVKLPELATQTVSGNLYVTIPLLQGTGLYSGQPVSITGSLYQPKPAANPGGFDFQAYLARSGGFAGLNGNRIELLPTAKRGYPVLAAIRQRVVRSQVQALGIPEGALMSAMVMGRNGVDIPYDLQDQFTQVGLAHTLAASGFQVSLLVGVVLTLSKKLSGKVRLGLGSGIIFAYIGLTGVQPSVLRAGIMGLAVLYAITTERKVKPLGSLLLAATLLLIFNPLWIWDLGFQFSFLATLGLLVTVSPLMKWLDWLPTTIAPLVAVPIAAYLWTLPLQLYVFGVVSPYSIPINILTAPLVTVLSIGGMISAMAALISPSAGSAFAWLLYYPTHGLVEAVNFVTQLPGNQFAIGTISPTQTIAIYGLLGFVWWQSSWQRYWTIALAMGISLVIVPAWYDYSNLTQVTALATSGNPALVVQNQGQVVVANRVTEKDASFTLLPFLKQQGINRIDGAIAVGSKPSDLAGWHQILKSIPIEAFYTSANLQQAVRQSFEANPVQIPLQQSIKVASTSAQLISTSPFVLQLQIQNQRWLLLNDLKLSDQQRLIATNLLPTAQVLVWAGQSLEPQLLQKVQPDVAIAAKIIAPETVAELQKQGITVYSSDRDGAIQWTAQRGFTTTFKFDQDSI